MLIELHQTDDVCILRFEGRFTTGVELEYLRGRAEELKQQACGKVLVDFRDVVSVGSTAIGFIVAIYSSVIAMPDGRFLVLQMHELLAYLNQQGVLSILVLAQHGLVGPMVTPVDISYLSDAVLMLRYFEFGGEVRRALSVVKKRSGHHEHTIREFRLTPNGIALGPPLTNFHGVFSGTPTYLGDSDALLDRDEQL